MNTNCGRNPASLTLAAFLCLFLHGGLGARAGPGESLRGFAPAQVEEQIAWEEKLRAIPRPALLREYMAKMAADPKTQEWWTWTAPMQVPLETRAPDEWWTTMKEVFHVD